MAYIGQGPGSSGTTDRTLDTVTSDGSTTTLPLTGTADTAEDVAVYFDGIMQRPGVDFTLASNTLTFASAVPNGVFVVAYTGGAEHIGSPSVGSVTSDMIVDNAVTNAKIATGVDASKIEGALGAFDGSALTGISSGGITKTSSDPTITDNPSSAGGLHLNTTSGEMFVCTDNTTNKNVWVNVGSGFGDVRDAPYGGRGLGQTSGFTSGGVTSTVLSNIDVYTFSSATTDAGSHGTLLVARRYTAGQSSSTRGYVSAGGTTVGAGIDDTIESFAFASGSDQTNVGNVTVPRYREASGQSSSTHGYTSGGNDGSSSSNVIDRFSFSSDGDATEHSSLSIAREFIAGHQTNTHGYVSGGQSSMNYNIIDRYSFSSNGNASNVGNLTFVRNGPAGHNSTTDGYVAGGHDGSTFRDTVTKFAFSSDITSSDVGTLTEARTSGCGHSSTTYGYTCGGSRAGNKDKIDRFSFASSSGFVASDVGNLTLPNYSISGQQY